MLRSLLIILGFATIAQIGAVDIYWTWVSGDDDWDNPNNWNTGTVPNANDNVYLSCSCNVDIPAGYVARARLVDVAAGVTLIVRSGGQLRIETSVSSAIEVDGWVRNWGEIVVQNPQPGISNYALSINSGGLVSNYGDLTVDDANTGIIIHGRLRNWGSVEANLTSGSNQSNGISVWTNGRLDNYSGAELTIAHTAENALINSPNASVHQRGEFTIRETCIDYGIRNAGQFLNYSTGSTSVEGATTVGFMNTNEAILRNYGLLTFSNSSPGTALNSIFGTVTNYSSGTIYIWGSNYEQGIRFAGTNKQFRNYGMIDVYTGQTQGEGVYFHTGTIVTNYATGVIDVSSRYGKAMGLQGSQFRNRGGTIELSVTGNNQVALEIGHSTTFDNEDCGTLILEDGLGLQATAVMTNEGWLEHHDYGYNNPFWNGALLINKGVIQDLGGRVHGFLDHIDNDEGVILLTPTDAIVFGQPYENLILAGPNTNVLINEDVFGDHTQNDWQGEYVGAPDYGVYFDQSSYSDPKYFYAEFQIPGCGNRIYNVYNNTPAPMAASGINQTEIATPTGQEQSLRLTAFPNPATEYLMVDFPATLQGSLRVDLRDLTGRLIYTQLLTPDQSNLRLDQPQTLTAGLYLLSVSDAAGWSETLKVTFAGQ